MSRTFSYCRVSTTEQTPENQLQEIRQAGFAISSRRAVEEVVSGSTTAKSRPQFARLLDRLEEGDILVVTKLDRLGRNAMDVRSTVTALDELGVKVHCLALGSTDLTSSAGKMVMGVITAVAEFERDLLIERTQAGLARAKATGKQLGRPPTLSTPQQREILANRRAGLSLSVLARHYGVSKSAIQRVERRASMLNPAQSSAANSG